MNKKFKNLDTISMRFFSFFKDVFFITIGCAIAGFGISCFLLPNHLSSGGFAGIATIMYYLFKLKMGTTIIILNLPLFVFGYFKTGKDFILKSIYSTFLYSKFIDMFDNTILINDMLLGSIYGGILVGVGLALIFKGKSSTGGTDLIAFLLQSYKSNVRISNFIIIFDFFIIGANLVVFREIEIGFYSFIVIFMVGKMIDIVFEGINFCKLIYIISDKYDEITNIINLEIKRGATNLYGRGSFTKKDKLIVMCVSKRRDIDRIRELSQKIDPNAFIIITDAREVYGLGFKN